ncbi:MAG: DUF3187 family protein [Planctomycetota bacterium]
MDRAGLVLLAALALSGACAIVPEHADAPSKVVRGPVPSRTLEPVKLTALAFRPRRATTLPEEKTELSVLSSYASIFEEGQTGGDLVLFDGEIWRTSLHLRRGIGSGADLEIELPVVYATSGFLDEFIENFHDFFGLPNGGREDHPRFQYGMVAVNGGTEAYHLEGNQVGMGDVPIVLTVSVLEESETRPALAVRGGIELPTGSDSDGFGNGKVDYGIGFLGERSFGRWTATGAIDWVDVQSSESFEEAGVEADDSFDLQLGLEYRWNDGLSLIAGSVYTNAPTQDIDLEEISGNMLSLDIGAAWDLGERSRLLLVFSEDLITQSAPDFSVTAAWTLSL